MISARGWRVELVLLLGFLLLTTLSGFSLAAVLVEKAFPEVAEDEISWVSMVFGTVGFHVATIVLVHFFLKLHRVSWGDFLGIEPGKTGRAVGKGLLAGLGALPFALALNKLSEWGLSRLGAPVEEQAAIQILRQAGDWSQYVLLGITAILLAPVIEEILFRGILYSVLREQGCRILGLWTSSLLFASIHLNLVTFVPLTFLALCLVWIYERTNSLLAPIVMHALFNAINFALLLVQVFFFPELVPP